ncbi:MAG TPA: hypothetical protein DCZ72_09450 [Armatimonadetes bacterium]|nr:hypothetical protein [Armatimonadota bacterium]
MRTPLLALLVLALCALAADQPAEVRISIETYTGQFVDWSGQAAEEEPGVDQSTDLTVVFSTPENPPEGATASLAVPASLGHGAVLPLTVISVEDAEDGEGIGDDFEGGDVAGEDGDPWVEDVVDVPEGMPEMRIYYGQAAEPHVIQGFEWRMSELTGDPQLKNLLEILEGESNVQGNAYWWPDYEAGQTTNVAPDVQMAGEYALTTSFAGNAKVTVPAGVRALGPFEWLAPALNEPPDWGQPVTLRWRAPAGTRAVAVMVSGQTQEGDDVLWTSVRGEPVTMNGVELTTDQVDTYLAGGWLLPADTTSVTVPGGIFTDCGTMSITLTAWGPGAQNLESTPRAIVQTRSYFNIHVVAQGVG